MDFLSRDGSPVPAGLWQKIDEEVVASAKKVLTGRRFLSIYGPLGAGVLSINVDDLKALEETEGDVSVIKGRKFCQIPLINQDFSLLWRDLEYSQSLNLPVDLSAVSNAANMCALKEDELIFYGNQELGYGGLANAVGIGKIQISDWSQGENPYKDIAEGLSKFLEKSIIGRYALILSPSLFAKLQRIQAGTGITEYERIKTLLGGQVLKTPVLKGDKAVLVCPEPQNMDLVIGQDMVTAYLETKNLNHYFRIFETILLRIKNKQAVIVFE